MPATYTYGTGAGLGTVTTTDPLGRTSGFTVGEFGQLTAVTAPGLSADAGFDPAGRLTSLGSTAVQRDAAGNVTAAIDPTGSPTRIDYDAGVRPVSVHDPNGNATTLAYDTAGQLVGVTSPDGTTTAIAYSTG